MIIQKAVQDSIKILVCKHRDYKENILHMENYERLIIKDVPGNTPREKHYNLQRMKQALQFWIHTFETHQEKISCVYDETGERFMPYNQLKQSKESLGLIKYDD